MVKALIGAVDNVDIVERMVRRGVAHRRGNT